MLLHMDGFDEYAVVADLAMEYYSTGGGSILTTGGRYGGGAIQVPHGGGAGIARALPTNPTDLWSGFAVLPTIGENLNNPFQLCNFIGNGGSCIFITYNYATSLFQVWLSAGGGVATVIGYETWLFVPNAWHWVEARCKLGNSPNGIVELWIDNVRVVNLTGIATNPTAPNNSATFTTMVLSSIAAPGTSPQFVAIYDDWYVLDTTGSRNNTRLGDSRIETRIPVSDAGTNNGTPSVSGPHFAMVDEVPWSSSDYVTLNNADGQEELYNMSPLVSSPATIFACRAITIMEKSDGGTMAGATVTVSSSVEADGPSTPGLNIWCHIDGIQETDPNTSGAWTTAAVNASQVGFKITT